MVHVLDLYKWVTHAFSEQTKHVLRIGNFSCAHALNRKVNPHEINCVKCLSVCKDCTQETRFVLVHLYSINFSGQDDFWQGASRTMVVWGDLFGGHLGSDGAEWNWFSPKMNHFFFVMLCVVTFGWQVYQCWFFWSAEVRWAVCEVLLCILLVPRWSVVLTMMHIQSQLLN